MSLEDEASVWVKLHRAYESLDVATASLMKQPQPVKRGDFVVLSPLSWVKTEPDLVLVFVNAEQADRIMGLVHFKVAEPFEYYPIGNICSCMKNVLSNGRPRINFLTVSARKWANYSPNVFIIVLPFRDFQAAVKNIPVSGFGTD